MLDVRPDGINLWGAGAMIGHYIEDDALDALALTGMLNGEGGISLTTSTSMNDFSDWLGDGDLDFVLVDIYRPDSLSFDDEVQRIRAHSYAPIFFITGDEAKFYENDALIVGAEGVLEKETLTPDGLIKALGNVVDRKTSLAKNGPVEANPDEWTYLVQDKVPAAPDLARFEVANDYLRDVLRTAATGAHDASDPTQTLAAIADVHALLEAFMRGAPASSQHDGKPIPQRIRHLQRASLAQAKHRGVKLIFQTEASVFDGAAIGRIDTAIRCVLNAVMLGSAKGSTIRFNGMSNADGVRLSIASDAPFPFDANNIIVRKIPTNPAVFGSTIFMTAMAMLFDLDEHSFTVFQRGGLNSVLIDIRDS